jgi:phenylalanyl-tRNA synthetase alpha chain
LQISAIQHEAIITFEKAENLAELDQARLFYLGKKGVIPLALKEMKKDEILDLKSYASALNQTKAILESAYIDGRKRLQENQIQAQLEAEKIDISLPGRGNSRKGLHPLFISLQRIERAFFSLGFTIADGPEIETSFYNFSALNMPENHPARSMHDTFYIDSEQVQLRTHTSPVQARYMQQHAEKYQHHTIKPEIRIISPGRTYRVDSDATHSPMFHQIEGLWVGENISFANLKWIVQEFLRTFFESDQIRTRFRPSFFPFTEPSAEIDVAFFDGPLRGKWLEIGGCGMVHPNVLRTAGIDAESHLGFAFGMGIDRLMMLRYGIEDLRMVYENDLRFLKQFA